MENKDPYTLEPKKQPHMTKVKQPTPFHVGLRDAQKNRRLNIAKALEEKLDRQLQDLEMYCSDSEPLDTRQLELSEYPNTNPTLVFDYNSDTDDTTGLATQATANLISNLVTPDTQKQVAPSRISNVATPDIRKQVTPSIIPNLVTSDTQKQVAPSRISNEATPDTRTQVIPSIISNLVTPDTQKQVAPSLISNLVTSDTQKQKLKNNIGVFVIDSLLSISVNSVDMEFMSDSDCEVICDRGRLSTSKSGSVEGGNEASDVENEASGLDPKLLMDTRVELVKLEDTPSWELLKRMRCETSIDNTLDLQVLAPKRRKINNKYENDKLDKYFTVDNNQTEKILGPIMTAKELVSENINNVLEDVEILEHNKKSVIPELTPFITDRAKLQESNFARIKFDLDDVQSIVSEDDDDIISNMNENSVPSDSDKVSVANNRKIKNKKPSHKRINCAAQSLVIDNLTANVDSKSLQWPWNVISEYVDSDKVSIADDRKIKNKKPSHKRINRAAQSLEIDNLTANVDSKSLQWPWNVISEYDDAQSYRPMIKERVNIRERAEDRRIIRKKTGQFTFTERHLLTHKMVIKKRDQNSSVAKDKANDIDSNSVSKVIGNVATPVMSEDIVNDHFCNDSEHEDTAKDFQDYNESKELSNSDQISKIQDHSTANNAEEHIENIIIVEISEDDENDAFKKDMDTDNNNMCSDNSNICIEETTVSRDDNTDIIKKDNIELDNQSKQLKEVDLGKRVNTRVNLPDIEEVRRNNQRIATAQVAPLTAPAECMGNVGGANGRRNEVVEEIISSSSYDSKRTSRGSINFGSRRQASKVTSAPKLLNLELEPAEDMVLHVAADATAASGPTREICPSRAGGASSIEVFRICEDGCLMRRASGPHEASANLLKADQTPSAQSGCCPGSDELLSSDEEAMASLLIPRTAKLAPATDDALFHASHLRDSGPRPVSRVPRWQRMSPDQKHVLKRHFKAKKYLTPSEKADIAADLNISEKKVQEWFQKRRWEWKRRERFARQRKKHSHATDEQRLESGHLSSEQYRVLEREFQAKKYLTASERNDIAADLNISEKKVQVWFNNRRVKLKYRALSTDVPLTEQEWKRERLKLRPREKHSHATDE